MTSYETERWSYALTHPSAIPIITNTRQAPFFSVLLFQCLSPLENWPITPPPTPPPATVPCLRILTLTGHLLSFECRVPGEGAGLGSRKSVPA